MFWYHYRLAFEFYSNITYKMLMFFSNLGIGIFFNCNFIILNIRFKINLILTFSLRSPLIWGNTLSIFEKTCNILFSLFVDICILYLFPYVKDCILNVMLSMINWFSHNFRFVFNVIDVLICYPISIRVNFKRTREKCGEVRAEGECFWHFSSVPKNSQVLIELHNARGTSVFISFIKCTVNCARLDRWRRLTCIISQHWTRVT